MNLEFRSVGKIVILPLVFLASVISVEKLNAQPTLRITTPADGTIVHPGQTILVTVEESPAQSIREMIIIPTGSIEFSQILHAPPWHFSVQVQPTARPGRYGLTADGVLGPGKGVSSKSVTVLVERADRLLKLKSDGATLVLRDVGDVIPLAVMGDFATLANVNLAESSYIKFESDSPLVATVRPDGVVTAIGPGRARITVSYSDESFVVPVTVR